MWEGHWSCKHCWGIYRLSNMLCVFGQQRSARHQDKHRRTSDRRASDGPTPEVLHQWLDGRFSAAGPWQ